MGRRWVSIQEITQRLGPEKTLELSAMARKRGMSFLDLVAQQIDERGRKRKRIGETIEALELWGRRIHSAQLLRR